jgi:RimJ/RimL family protein N-acetyltransferase
MPSCGLFDFLAGQGLSDGVVALRRIAPGDIPRLYEWRNDPGTRRMFRDSRPLEFESHRRFVEGYLESGAPGYWLIVEAADIPVGTISLYDFSADGRECEFGRFIIAPGHRGSGYGRRTLALLMAFAASLGVKRIRCEVLASNEPALCLYGSLGFRSQGQDGSGERTFVLMETELSGT